jgi:hypothetical protein
VRTRFVKLALTALSAAAFAGMASACGGGDGDLALGEYFERVKAIHEVGEKRFAPVTDDFSTVGDPKAAVQDRIEALRNALNGLVAANRARADDYDRLDPPSQVEEQHNELVGSISAVADLWAGLGVRAEEVDSQSDLKEFLAEFEKREFVEVLEGPGRVCVALQTVADENNVKVDLACDA